MAVRLGEGRVDYPQKTLSAALSPGSWCSKTLQAASTKAAPFLNIGLTHADYPLWPEQRLCAAFGQWQPRHLEPRREVLPVLDQSGTDDGKFSIDNIRPGTYTLHAFADGVLGEFAQANITVTAGQTLDLGKVEWKPVRYGKQLWDIGYSDRTSDKFFKGDGANYWLWGWPLRYALLFPNDLTYTIGKSDYRKDWFFEEVPHADDLSFVNPEAKDPANQRFGWVKAYAVADYPQATDTVGPWRIWGRGHATTWTIKFNVDKKRRKARRCCCLALAGGGWQWRARGIGVNGKGCRHHLPDGHQCPAL